MDSILNSIKKQLGLGVEYEHFDPDIIIHINTALSVLTQLGVGPSSGYMITGPAEKWSDFMGKDPRLNCVVTYVYLKVKKIFDPTLSTAVKQAIDESIAELEWRIHVTAEDAMYNSNQHM